MPVYNHLHGDILATAHVSVGSETHRNNIIFDSGKTTVEQRLVEESITTMSFRLPFGLGKSAAGVREVPATSDTASEVSDGSLKYVFEQGGNDSTPSYQEATGAPVETDSPLGYAVGPVTIIFLNISKMIGTGIYSTRKKDSFPVFPLR